MRTPLLVIIVTFAISIIGMVLIPGVDANGKPYHMNFFDAFYFVTYMASTIGFGEIPYEFTYAQRMWVMVSIYIAVIGWFYAIGALVTLIQDKNLINELKIAKFSKKIKELKEPFVIILGYNNTTKNLIYKLTNDNKRIVVIDKAQEKIDELELENFVPEVYAIAANITTEALRLAGIKKRNCKALVSLFDNDFKNTKIALLVKLLNPKLNIIVKSSTLEQNSHLKNLGIKNIIDPFALTANRFYLALSSPYAWLIEMMIFKHYKLLETYTPLPKGKYIICGYGRMGKALIDSLKRANIDYSYIDLKSSIHKSRKKSAIFGDAQDYQELIKAGVKEASAVVAATKDDLINLTILLTAKKINPDIYTIGRENSLDDITVFSSANIDRVYILEDIISENVHQLISMPLAHRFMQELYKKECVWCEDLSKELKIKTDYRPEIFEIRIVHKEAYAITDYLKEGGVVNIGMVARNLSDRTKRLDLVVLLVKNRREEVTILPDDNYEIKVSDRLLIAATKEAREDFELLLNNINEFYYAINGKEHKFGIYKLIERMKNE